MMKFLPIAAPLALAILARSAPGATTFAAGPTLATAQRPSAAAVADFNADQIPDIAVTVDTPDRILVFTGTAGGQFAAPVPIFVGSGARDLWATDIEGDGDSDLVVVLHNQNQIRAYVNNGLGAFTPGSLAAVGSNARGGSMLDLNADGRADFVVANRDSNSVSVVMNVLGTLTSTSLPVGDEPYAVGAGDLDGDGDGDLAVANHGSRNVTIYRNTAGAFSLAATLSVPANERPSGIAVADVTGDDRPDVVASAGDDGVAGFLAVYRNLGNASFAPPTVVSTLGVNPGTMGAADLDADGDTDLVAANEDSDSISVLDNLGGGAFAPATVIATGAHPERITIAHAAGTTMPDIIVPNRDSNTTTILANLAQQTPDCPADLDNGFASGLPDGAVGIDDLIYYVDRFEIGHVRADLDNGSGSGASDGAVTIDDLIYFLARFEGGC